MNDFDNHHIVPEGLKGFVRDTFNIDVDRYAWNRIDLPVSGFAGVPTHGRQGNHTYVGYRPGVTRALENIRDNVAPALQKEAVTRLMNGLRLAIMRNEVDLFGKGDTHDFRIGEWRKPVA